MDSNGGAPPLDGSLASGKRAPSPGPGPTPAEAGSSEAKRPRLDGDVAMKVRALYAMPIDASGCSHLLLAPLPPSRSILKTPASPQSVATPAASLRPHPTAASPHLLQHRGSHLSSRRRPYQQQAEEALEERRGGARMMSERHCLAMLIGESDETALAWYAG